MAISLFMVPGNAAAASYSMYDDSLASPWISKQWGATVNLASTAPVHSGRYAVAVTVTGSYGAWAPDLRSNSFDASPYTGIQLYINGGSTGGQKLALMVSLDDKTWGARANINSYIAGGAIAANQWRLVQVPLSALGAAGAKIKRIAVTSIISSPQPTYYLDDIQFYGANSPVAAPATATPVAPTATPKAASTPVPTPATVAPTATPKATSTPAPTATTVVPTAAPAPASNGSQMFGVNLASAAFGSNMPGTYGTDYTYTGSGSWDYYHSKGLNLIRLPFRWERVQPTLYGPLDPTELGRLDTSIGYARSRGMKVILDVHNWGRWCEPNTGSCQVIGTSGVPNGAFVDLWSKLAAHYKGETAIWAYGLMNEPHGQDASWPATLQAVINAIRQVDMTHTISVPGDLWSTAWYWPQYSDYLKNLTDPANNLIFEAHSYWDSNGSGSYNQSYSAQGAYPTIGVDRVKPFVDWLHANNKRGFVGEYGTPDGVRFGDAAQWNVVLDNFLSYIRSNGLSGTYWAGGAWVGKGYIYIEPVNGVDQPQMSVVQKYTGQ